MAMLCKLKYRLKDMNNGRKKRYRDRASTARRERLRLSPGDSEPCDRTTSISDPINSILQRLRLSEDLWTKHLADDWADIAGDVATHSRPLKVEKGCLWVAVNNSVWLSELKRFGESPLLKRLEDKGFAGRVKSVRFVIG